MKRTADQVSVGILGGGQLGLMLAESLLHLGASVATLEPDPESPSATRLAQVKAKAFTDAAAIKELFSRCDVVTFDSENVPEAPLRRYAAQLRPRREVLAVSQDRKSEKAFLTAAGAPVVRHQPIARTAELPAAIRAFGFPCIVKTTLGGYDGKGQYRFGSAKELTDAKFEGAGPWILEEQLTLTTEISCIVARPRQGKAFCFPVFENFHQHHILDVTVLPARVSPALQKQARKISLQLAEALDVEGLLTVEFFVGRGRDGRERLYVNELAPRPHNSGHVTRQACTMSQFEALARILVGAPLFEPVVHPGAWCMGNLLGDVWEAQGRSGGDLDLSAWAKFPDVVDVFLYGKAIARPKRKMGHFVVRAKTADQAVRRARAFRVALMRAP